MNAIDAILLGVLQGLTEFLPISSSAHLVAGQALLNARPPGVALEVALHVGSLAAIVVVLRREVSSVARDGLCGAWGFLRGCGLAGVKESAPLFPVAVAVVVGTVPAAVAGLALGDAISGTFESLAVGGALLCVTGLVLLSSRFAPAPRVSRVGPGRGVLIGIAQAFALFPGISRSGATIVAARWAGVEGAAAGRFSFLLAIPAVLGAAVLKLAGGGATAGIGAVPLVLGMAASAVCGALGLVCLLRILRQGRIHWFAAYCIPAGLLMTVAGLRG
jgi:undecaprenyl-diphosphatase